MLLLRQGKPPTIGATGQDAAVSANTAGLTANTSALTALTARLGLDSLGAGGGFGGFGGSGAPGDLGSADSLFPEIPGFATGTDSAPGGFATGRGARSGVAELARRILGDAQRLSARRRYSRLPGFSRGGGQRGTDAQSRFPACDECRASGHHRRSGRERDGDPATDAQAVINSFRAALTEILILERSPAGLVVLCPKTRPAERHKL